MDALQTEILRANLDGIRRELEQNRYQDEKPARLIAVTKTVSPEVINPLYDLGQTEIAENRVQVVLEKRPKLNPKFQLHLIGQLQSNKVKSIIGMITLLHSLDRMSLATEIERRGAEIGRVVPALVQVNVAREPQKAGLSVEELRPFLHEIKDYQNLHVVGLMSMMPKDAPEEALTKWFRQMRQLYDELRLEALPNVEMKELSMGMSGDYRIAAREGATMVRIGSALFNRVNPTGGSFS